MEDIILKTNNICKVYYDFYANDHINMTVNKGDIYGFVGKNGSGKTTFMRAVSSLIKPTSGSIELFGNPLSNNSLKELSCIIENPALYPHMSAFDNLKSQCYIYNIEKYRHNNIIESLLELVNLSDTGKKKVRDFSLGMRQRLGIAMSLVNEPKFLILDEPTNGLDPQGICDIRELLIKLNKEKDMTILISSHILAELEKLATRFGFIDDGKLIKEITASELEEECKSQQVITVDNIPSTILAFNKAKIDYTLDGAKFKINTTLPIGDIFDILSKDNIKIISSNIEKMELETYFFNLIGGGENE